MGRQSAALYRGVTARVLVVIVVLIGATAFGLARRRNDGKLRGPRAAGPKLRGPRAAGPKLRGPRAAGPKLGDGQELRVTEADLGRPLGHRATLLQFSSSFCAPCRATRQVLAEVADGAEGIAHVEIDVADRVDLVRMLDVRRTPTTFLIGSDGCIASRASGAPRKADVLAALGGVA
jgi:thiol-disulfide isomerase/thioredoxin